MEYQGSKFIALLLCGVLFMPIAHSLTIQEWDTPTGTKVMFVPVSQIPMVNVKVILPVGSIADSKNLGVAHLAAKLVGTSTRNYSRLEFARAIESTGAEYDVSSGYTTTTLRFRSLSEEGVLGKVEALMAEALSQPNPQRQDFQQIKDSIIHELENDKSDPATQAANQAMALLFAGHPYGKPIKGTLESVKDISRSEVKNIYKKHYSSQGAIVVIVGALTKKRAATLANTLTKALPQHKQMAIPVLPPVPAKSTTLSMVTMDTEQTHILYAMRAPNQKSPDFYKIMIVNHILGGNGFSSRLMKSIRTKEGLAYSAASWQQPLLESGAFFINVQTKNKSRDRVQTLIKKELAAMAPASVSNTEYKEALDNLINRQAFITNSNSKIADLVATIALYDLPRDYLATRVNRLTAISKKESLATFSTLLKTNNPDSHWVKVVVGPNK